MGKKENILALKTDVDWKRISITTRREYWMIHVDNPESGLLDKMIENYPSIVNRKAIYDDYNRLKREQDKRCTEKKLLKIIEESAEDDVNKEDLSQETNDNEHEKIEDKFVTVSELDQVKETLKGKSTIEQYSALEQRLNIIQEIVISLHTKNNKLRKENRESKKRISKLEKIIGDHYE